MTEMPLAAQRSTLPPFVISMSCTAGYFGGLDFWDSPSLMEELLRAENKGTAAAFMPTGQTDTQGQQILNAALFEAADCPEKQRAEFATLREQKQQP